MSKKGKSPNEPKPYESMAGERAFTKVFDSMLLSPAFTDLTPKQRMLYIVCKAQEFGHGRPTTQIDGNTFFQTQEFFFMSCEDIKPYALYGECNKRDFYADMKTLQTHGFIELVSNGKRMKHKNVYKLSSRWQKWTPESDGKSEGKN